MSRGSMGLSDVQLLSVFETFDEGVIVADKDGRIVFYNQTQAQLDDMDVDYVTGKKVTEVYHLDDESSMIMRCLRSGRPIKGEIFFYRTCRGKLTNTIHSVYPLGRNGIVTGAICFVKDYNYLEKTIASASRMNPHETHTLGNGTRYRFTDIVGGSAQSLEAVKLARLSADTPSPIMLQGETGTGKEMFAQSIHNYSARRHRPFIGINCAAIPENLLEGLLFGTARGAFTGAVEKRGLFEQAHQSTLLLDEVDSMPMSLQAKLLRVLQERQLRRVGGNDEIPVDLKIISSVSSDPHRAIQDGKLRMDLFHRLAVVHIRIPSLRESKSSIEALTRHFIFKNNLMLGKNIIDVGRGVMELFMNHPWPGNIRELEHVVEGAMNVCERDGRIEFEHLPGHFLQRDVVRNDGEIDSDRPRRDPAETTSSTIGAGHRFLPEPCDRLTANPGRNSLKEIREKEECDTIVRAVSESGGNLAHAARSLGISRQLLYYKLKKYGLKTPAV